MDTRELRGLLFNIESERWLLSDLREKKRLGVPDNRIPRQIEEVSNSLERRENMLSELMK